MFDANFITLYSSTQLEQFREQFQHRVDALTALVLAGKPRMDGLEEVSEQLDIIEDELRRRPAR